MTGILGEEGLKCVGATSRAEDVPAARAEILTVKPRLVIATLGRTHGMHEGSLIPTIDYLEKPGRLVENLRDNLAAPLNLAFLCKEIGVRYMYIATGCIFGADDIDSIADESVPGFTEEDVPNFTGSSYSTVKGFTDRLFSNFFCDSALFLRIRMPISHDLNSRSFLAKITKYEKVCSISNSMTVLDGPQGLLRLFLKMAMAGDTGCYNGTNPGVMNHNQILQEYTKVEPEFTWKNFTLEEQNAVLAAGRSNNRLSSTKLEKRAAELGFDLPDLLTAMRGVMESLRQQKERGISSRL